MTRGPTMAVRARGTAMMAARAAPTGRKIAIADMPAAGRPRGTARVLSVQPEAREAASPLVLVRERFPRGS